MPVVPTGRAAPGDSKPCGPPRLIWTRANVMNEIAQRMGDVMDGHFVREFQTQFHARLFELARASHTSRRKALRSIVPMRVLILSFVAMGSRLRRSKR